MHCFERVLFDGFNVICAICGKVSVLHTVLYVFSFIVWYVRSLRTFLNSFCKICSHVSALCTVLNMFCMIFWYVSASRTVLKVFCRMFC